MKESERQKIIEQAKENFWEQKGDEFGKALVILIPLTLLVFGFLPCLGKSFAQAWGLAPASYWFDMYLGLLILLYSILALMIIALLIWLPCKIIKLIIDSNIEKAFNRAIDEVHVTKSKRGGKTK
jgi:uncharacterized BrkB/YihY/UPF0761 family membrane protein